MVSYLKIFEWRRSINKLGWSFVKEKNWVKKDFVISFVKEILRYQVAFTYVTAFPRIQD